MRSVNWYDGLQNRVPRFNSGRGLHKTPEKSLVPDAGGAHVAPLVPGASVQKPGQRQTAFVSCSTYTT